ncbi:hypothetical protein [Tistlia consotensis]|uniref:hypothetical protein n=1 Tax=Tistlia consotensis TaxID=1321365 RepID=UPI000A14C669|nr:hypothetical protein [Tistlia consotensis]
MARCRQDEQVWWVDDLGTFRAVDRNSDDLWRSQPIGDDERSHRLAFRLMRLVKVMEGGRHLTVQWDACWVDETALQAAVAYVHRRHREVRAVHLRYCVGAWIDECFFSGSMAATRMEQILGLRGATPFLGTTVLERPLERLACASRPLRHGFDAWRRLCWRGRLPAAEQLIDALGPDLRFAESPELAPLVFWYTDQGLPSWQVTTEDLWDAFLADLPSHLGRTLSAPLRRQLLQQLTPRFDHLRLPFTWPEEEAYWFRFERLILPVRRADGRADLMTLCVPSDEIDIPMMQGLPAKPRSRRRNPLDSW